MKHYNTTKIHATPIKTRYNNIITKAWEDTFAILKKHGKVPNIQILDNECSYNLKQAFDKANVKYQLVLPRVHQ